MVRAKFVVVSVTRRKHWDQGVAPFISEIELGAVTGGSPENKEFFAASPSGTLKLGVLNEKAAEQFTPGQHFFIDFTPTGE